MSSCDVSAAELMAKSGDQSAFFSSVTNYHHHLATMADAATTKPIPTDEELEDVVYAARYGDLDDVKAFIDSFGASALAAAHDESGNTVLHMAAANGHTGEHMSPSGMRAL